MTRIKIEVEFEISDSWCANSEHQEEREWFWNDVIPSCMVVLHSNEVGDTISQTDSFTIKKISTTAREYTSPVIEELINESNQEKMKLSSIDTLWNAIPEDVKQKMPFGIYEDVFGMHYSEIKNSYKKGYEDRDFSYFDPECYYSETFE